MEYSPAPFRLCHLHLPPDSYLRPYRACTSHTKQAVFAPFRRSHFCRWYFAYDHNDRVFENEAHRRSLTAMILRTVEAEDARRWHPPGYSRPPSVGPDGHILIDNPEILAIDNSALVVSVHWVQ